MPYYVLCATDYDEWYLPTDFKTYRDESTASIVAQKESENQVTGVFLLDRQEWTDHILYPRDKAWKYPIYVYIGGVRYIPSNGK